MLNSLVGIIASSGGAAGGGSYESIASATGTGSSGTITFSSIPSTYASLQIRGIAFNSVSDYLILRVNSDSGTNYSRHFLHGTGVGVAAGASTSTTGFRFDNLNLGTSSTFGDVFIIDLHNYASTTQNKTMRAIAGIDTNGDGQVTLSSSAWLNTSAITSVTISVVNGNSFTTNTQVALYGIKGA